MKSRRAGFTLAEALVATTSSALLLTLVAAVLAAHERLARTFEERAASVETARTAALVLDAELDLLAGADIGTLAGDSTRIRAIRAAGTVCGTDTQILLLGGVRDPDPAKDSLLEIDTDRLQALGSAAAVHDACGAARAVRVTTDEALTPGAIVLVFESGTYYLRDAALRYRRGAEGRQPLTPERLLSASSLRRSVEDSAALQSVNLRLAVAGLAPLDRRILLLNPLQ